MAKINCWEYKNCGRIPGGDNVDEAGECPVATYKKADGFCDGKNAGRSCMYMMGTCCDGEKQNQYEDKKEKCQECGFFRKVRDEEGKENSPMKFFEYIEK